MVSVTHHDTTHSLKQLERSSSIRQALLILKHVNFYFPRNKNFIVTISFDCVADSLTSVHSAERLIKLHLQ
jgi:hypothetical protein